MKTGLCNIYKALMPEELDEELESFLKSIEGKQVELRFVHGDAFEKNDNNYWLPNELWDELN